MTAVPPETPVTVPVLATVAIAVAPLLQVPPTSVLVSNEVATGHITNVPVTVPAEGLTSTVTTLVADCDAQPFVVV